MALGSDGFGNGFDRNQSFDAPYNDPSQDSYFDFGDSPRLRSYQLRMGVSMRPGGEESAREHVANALQIFRSLRVFEVAEKCRLQGAHGCIECEAVLSVVERLERALRRLAEEAVGRPAELCDAKMMTDADIFVCGLPRGHAGDHHDGRFSNGVTWVNMRRVWENSRAAMKNTMEAGGLLNDSQSDGVKNG